MIYRRSAGEQENVKFRGSLYFVEDLKVGDVITADAVRNIRLGLGLASEDLEHVLGRLVEQIGRYFKVKYSEKLNANIFASAATYGCDGIIISTLSLNKDLSLPITIPHGIDSHQLMMDLDLHCHEPIYMAFRDDIAERVEKFKIVLKFPHPWLLIIAEHKNRKGNGTLFIAPPPSIKNFEAILLEINGCDYPKPWGVLIKDRGVRSEDFQWWEKRGFAVHTAGSSNDKKFFYKLREIIGSYACVASPNMSSAVIFAVAMNRAAFALPNVQITCVDADHLDEIIVLDDTDGKIASVWRNLLSDDLILARSQAENLLGMKYMDEPEELRKRITKAIASVADKPVHLFPSDNRFLYNVCIWLMGKGIPVQKLFPNPLKKILNRTLSYFRLNRLTIISGSDFAHYGVAGDYARLQLREVFAFNLSKSSAMAGRALRDSAEHEPNS